MKVGNKEIKNFSEPFVIADAASNHKGDMNTAKQMIDKAVECGCDCIKFQSWTKTSLFSRGIYRDNAELEKQLDDFTFSLEQLRELKKYCDKKGIMFSASVFCKEEADFFADELDVPFIKIASMDINNHPFLEYLAKKGKPIILSTGLADISEIDEAVRLIQKHNKNLILLHCVALYPPKDEQMNLNNIDLLRDTFGLPVGYSDHTFGAALSLASVAKGACVIEKHFALDKNADIWDKGFSADPQDMKIIVEDSRRIANALGSYRIVLDEANINQRAGMRRSIISTKNLKAGHVLAEDDLDCKRPGSGIEPKFLNLIAGRTLKREIAEEDLIKQEDLV